MVNLNNYRFSSISKSDINECVDEEYFNCTDVLHHCVNNRGSYKCECEFGLYLIDEKCQGKYDNNLREKRLKNEMQRGRVFGYRTCNSEFPNSSLALNIPVQLINRNNNLIVPSTRVYTLQIN